MSTSTSPDHDNTNGLLDAWVFDGKGQATAIDWDNVANYQLADDEWLWLHLNYADNPAQQWMNESSGLSELTVSALLAAETRPRCTPADNGLMVFLRGVNLNPGADPEDMVSIRLWLNERQLISLRRQSSLSIEDIRASISLGEAPKAPGEFVVMLIDLLLDRASNVTEGLYDEVDELEASLHDEPDKEQRAQLANIHRQAITLRRFFAPQREAVGRLSTDRSLLFTDEHRTKLREDMDRLTRLVEALDAARERAQVVQELIANRIAEQTGKRMYTLSILSAVFLPLTFITGLLGTNVGGIPGATSEWGFWIVSGLVGIVALGIWAFFRYSRWY